MAELTCADCGSAMRQGYMVLSMAGGCSRIPCGPPECSNEECRQKQAEQDRADRAAHEESVIQDAIDRGLIVAEHTYGKCTACGSVEVVLVNPTGTADLSGIGESAEYPTGHGCEVCA